MDERNEFRAYRKKNKTKSSHYYINLTALALLLLSPLETSAVDSSQKLRGNENDLGNLSYESIADSVIDVPTESGNVGLSTGEEEDSPNLPLILHESSIFEAQVEEAELIDTKSSNVQKNDFVEQAKMASDQSLSMTLKSDTDNHLVPEHNGFTIDKPHIVLKETSLSLVTETISSAGKLKSNPMQKPTRAESNLPDDDWDIVERGTEAIDIINSLISVIPEGDSPQELMQTFAGICDIIGEYVSAFGLVGQALGIVAIFLPGPDDAEEPDPMIEYMDERFDIIEEQLENVLNRFDEVMLHSCFTSWDNLHQIYIQNFEANYELFTSSRKDERSHGFGTLYNQCGNDPPFEYINAWKNTILSAPGTFSECMQMMVDNASNRVLYLRRHFTSVVLSNIFKAARYDGICYGVRNTGTARVSVQLQSANDDDAGQIEGYFREIKGKFEEIEVEMYNAPISNWKSILQDEYEYHNARKDENVVMNALKYDFYPDYRYAAYRFTKNQDLRDSHFFSFFGHGGDDYGSFQLDSHDQETVVVFYRNRSNRQRLDNLTPRFDNCVCGGDTMCERNENDRCQESHCHSPWHQVHENSRRNNRNLHDLYASRGAVLVKTYDRNGGPTVDRTYPALENDSIASWFFTAFEGDADAYRYKIYYIRGYFSCDQSRQCSSNDICGTKCSGTAPTPSVSCAGTWWNPLGNPRCSNDNECPPQYKCRNSALYTGSTNFANLLSKGLARTYLHKTDAFMNDDDCESGSVARTSRTCQVAPAPAPCFSSESKVNILQKGLVPISEIKVGDYVLSKMDGSFSRVYALEKNHYGESKFHQLLSSSGTILELTDRHMIYLKNKSNPIPARDVKVGDILETDGSETVSGEVTKIEVIRRNGYYNPLTEDGTIILNNGVVASSFSVAKSSSSNFFDASTELIHWHFLSHLGNAPLRFVCKAVSFSLCTDEKHQNEQGLHKFVVLLKRASNLPNWAQAIVFPFIFGMGVFFSVLELMYDKAEALLEVVSSAEAARIGGFGFLITFSLVTALAVPGMLALRKRYFL